MAERITSTEFITKYALASASAVHTALKSLIKDSLVVRKDDHYFLYDKFFRIWLERNY